MFDREFGLRVSTVAFDKRVVISCSNLFCDNVNNNNIASVKICQVSPNKHFFDRIVNICSNLFSDIVNNKNSVCDNSFNISSKNRCNKIFFGHVNCRGLNAMSKNCNRLDIICGILLQRNIFICSLTETFLTGDNVPLLPSIYEWFGINRFSSRGGGVGIIVLRKLAAKEINFGLNLEIEYIGIQFVYNNKVVCFISIYLPQKSFQEIHECNKLFAWINRQSFDVVLLGGDFNAWCTAWGDINNPRGLKLYDYISSHGFGVTKMPAPTRIGNITQRDSFIDFFVSHNMVMLDDVQVGPLISDHMFCSCSINFGPKSTTRRRIPNFYKTYLCN